jgi:phenylpropionate dioxygenase-like ring-hydroxylating dioxygenase large terminal subunit
MSGAGSGTMADGDRAAGATEPKSGFGRGFLYDLWYFVDLGAALKPGRLQRYEMLGQPLLLGRTRAGQAFALRDICPHRAAPLSAGKLVAEPDGSQSVQCPYHGWRFAAADGACAAIPSLLADQEVNIDRIRVRAYPVQESQGLVFVYMAADARSGATPASAPPTFPGAVGGGPKLIDRMTFDTHLDHAVVGLMDPTHGPYVHQQWWWRSASRQGEAVRAPGVGVRHGSPCAVQEQPRLPDPRRGARNGDQLSSAGATLGACAGGTAPSAGPDLSDTGK